MSGLRFDLGNGFYLSAIRDGDQAAYLEHFRDKELADALLDIPFPYTERDADRWVGARVGALALESDEPQLALRRPDGFLVGGACLVVAAEMKRLQAEIGFWIARDYRRRGLMRAAIRALVGHGFETMGVKRIVARVEPDNTGSQRILETEGFVGADESRLFYWLEKGSG